LNYIHHFVQKYTVIKKIAFVKVFFNCPEPWAFLF